MIGTSDRGPRTKDAAFEALKRSATVNPTVERAIDATPVAGNLVGVGKPKFISLVGLPANQTPIKVIRDDGSVEEPAAKSTTKPPLNPQGDRTMVSPVIRRQRRSQEGAAGPVLSLTFPEGTDGPAVTAALESYGLVGYVITNEAGVYTATRSDLKSIANDKTMEIKLSKEGLIARVARQDGGLQAKPDKANITLARMEFDSTKFTLTQVQRWVAENAVDETIQEPQNPGECYVVRRSDIPANEETRRMVLEDGIEVVLIRSDLMSIPANFVTVVNESAYGSWGWGQLDFAATMADDEFCDQMCDAIETLYDVLWRIVVYSTLPIDIRKDLANRALAQFGEYIGTVLDSLPRQLIVAVLQNQDRSAVKTQRLLANTQTSHQTNPTQPLPISENSMTQVTTPAAQVTPAPAVSTAAAPDASSTLAQMTRADVGKMISEIVEAAVARAVPKSPEELARLAKEAEDARPLTRSDLAAVIADATKPLVEKVAALEGKTIVRDTQEALPGTGEDAPNTAASLARAEPAKKDVFRGASAFAGLRVVPTQK